MDRYDRLARLSPEKRKLFELMLCASVDHEQMREIPRLRRTCAPLSFAQERLWFLDKFEPQTPAYNVPVVAQLGGPLDLEALRSSFEAVVARHEVLRTCYREREGVPEQVIESTWRGWLGQLDLSACDRKERPRQLQRLITADMVRPFDLAHGPVLRVRVIRLGEQDHVLALALHHIATDGWSLELVIRDVAAIYEALVIRQTAALPELPIQYADYAQWQRESFARGTLQDQLAYWQKQLAGIKTAELPSDRRRTAVQHSAGLHIFELGRALSRGISELAKSRQATVFMGLLAAFDLLLYYWTQQTDVVVGTDVAGRNRSETEDLVGFFINQLVLRTDLSGNPDFLTVLDRVREVCLNAYAHQDLPFDRLVEALNPSRSFSHPPFFRTKLVLQNTPAANASFSQLRLTQLQVPPLATKCDLTLTFSEVPENFWASFEYSVDLFERETILRLEWLLKTVLSEVTSRPGVTLTEIAEAVRKLEDMWLQTKGQELRRIRQQKFDILRVSGSNPDRKGLSSAVDERI